MRMRIGLRRRAVRRPARMADSGDALERLLVEQMPKLDQLARTATALDLTADQRGDARRIIAAIFEPLQRIDDQRRHVARSGNADDSAHRQSLFFLARFLARMVSARPGFVTWRPRATA